MKISCVVPTRDPSGKGFQKLLRSIKRQNYPQDKIEVIPVTEGDSEEAKAIGIRRATGDIIGMFCDDNVIVDKDLFRKVRFTIKRGADACYPKRYFYTKRDYCLNRYFSLIGGNDPVCWYLGKNDRESYVNELSKKSDYPPSYGCNGFFYRAEVIKQADLDHYYPMDCAVDVIKKGYTKFVKMDGNGIWHQTSTANLFHFLKKRYIYARDLYSERDDRRWRMVDTKKDQFGVASFVGYSASIILPIITALKGFGKVRDFAWFWHPVVCLGFTITYGILTCRNILKFQLWYRPLDALKPLGDVSKA